MIRGMLTSGGISFLLTFLLSFNSGIGRALVMATLVGLLSMGISWALDSWRDRSWRR